MVNTLESRSDLEQVFSDEVTPRLFTITDFLRILEEPVVIGFLAEKLGLTLEEVQKQLSNAKHQPLTFEEQRRLIQNRIEAEKQVAPREGRKPSVSNHEHGLVAIEKRKSQNDKTDHYGVVRTTEDLMESPTEGEMAAQDKILAFYGF